MNKLNEMKRILFLSIVILFAVNLNAQQTGTFKDPRDGETYSTITIEDPLLGTKVIWMAQNLRFRAANSWAYNNEEKYVKNLGRLYTWEAAQKVCPPEWRLPSVEDWEVLKNEFGGNKNAGAPLKSIKGWKENGNGSNASGFSAFPGGARNINGSFRDIRIYGYWWSASESNATAAYFLYISYSSNYIDMSSWFKEVGFSVRCLRD